MERSGVEFNIKKDGGSVFDLPLSMRTMIYKEIMELLDEVEGGPDKDGNYPGCESNLLPMVYIIGKNDIIGILYVKGEDGTYDNGKKIALRIDIKDLDRLVEE